MTNGMINRKYKDSLFRMIFRERKELLGLYNAINDSDFFAETSDGGDRDDTDRTCR